MWLVTAVANSGDVASAIGVKLLEKTDKFCLLDDLLEA